MAERLIDPAAPAAASDPDLSGRAAWLERLSAYVSHIPWAGVALAGVLGAIVLVHRPVLDHYFFGDDFVPLADIASRSTWGYVKDLFLLDDLTPNWRFLTGLVYLALYRAFGLDAFPFLLTSVVAHVATAGLIFWFVRRVTGEVWPSVLAAGFFGLTAAHARTVGQVTAFNNVLAALLIMVSLVTWYEALDRRRMFAWGGVAVVAFAAAIAANESVAVLAAVPALMALWKLPEGDDWWREPRQWTAIALASAPFVVVGGTALLFLTACGCTEAAKPAVFHAGDNMLGTFWTYLGRLLYPIGMSLPGEVTTAHLVAGSVLAAILLAALLRGPALARISVVFLILALIPYLPITFALAPRYLYVAAIPFSILAALIIAEATRLAGRLTPALAGVIVVAAFGVMGLYGWQTWEQNQFLAKWSLRWEAMAVGLEEAYPELPAGSRVYVRGGPLTDPLLGFYVLPALGETLWSDVFVAVEWAGAQEFCAQPGQRVYVVDFDGGRFTPVPVIYDGQSPAQDDGGSGRPGALPPAYAVDCPPSEFPQ